MPERFQKIRDLIITVINIKSETEENKMTMKYSYKLPEGMSTEEAQGNVDHAYNILFNEVEKARSVKLADDRNETL